MTALPRVFLLIGLGTFAAVAAVLFVTQTKSADSLEQVRARGQLVCGVPAAAPPFGFLDQSRQLTGYDVDFCKAIARRIGVRAELVPVSVEQRILELNSGRVDMLAAVLGWTPTRARQIDYSDQYFVSRQVVIVRPTSQIRSFADLNGRKVSAAKGSSAEEYLRVLAPSAKLLTFQDPSSGYLALTQGKVDAMAVSDLAAIRFRNQSSFNFKTLPTPLKVEIWGLAVRKGQKPLLREVNGALEGLERSGEAAAIFDKWFGPHSQYAQSRSFVVQPIDAAKAGKSAPAGAAGVLREPFRTMLLHGLLITIQLFVYSWLIAFGFGLALTLFRFSSIRAADWVVSAYVEVSRNVPLLAQIMFWYFAVPAILPSRIQAWIAVHDGEFILATLALGFALAGYFSEAIRSGLRAVPTRQMEAGRALGFSYFSTMRYVVLPQGLKAAIPPVVNITILLFQNTSIALAIGVHELMYETRGIENDTYQAVPIYALATVIYVLGSNSLTLIGRHFEKRLAVVGR